MSSRIMPASFTFSDKHRAQVKAEYKIEDKEVDRQLRKIGEHEFARPYSHWHLVCLRWFRKANDLNDLQRARRYRNTQHGAPSIEERADDQRKFDEMVEGLRVVK
jgi:hypothetical protein